MDSKNLFLTPTTYRLWRLENLVLLGVAAGFAAVHLEDIRWPVFVALFFVIDLVGYLPGVLAHRRSGSAHLPRRYHVLYNTAHSLVTAVAVAGLWCLLVRPEWALLALPLHLLGDRALFGNFAKPFGLAFEPAPHPAYAAVKPSLDFPHRPDRVGVPGPALTPAHARVGA